MFGQKCEKLNNFINSIEKNFGELSSFMNELSESLKPLGITSLQIIGFMMLQFQAKQDQFKELENERMKWVDLS
jgi:hypothetical protein